MKRRNIKQNIKNILIISFCVSIIGAGTFLVGMINVAAWNDIKDEKYLENDDISLSDMDNATYQWTSKQLNKQITNNFIFSLIGILIMFIGTIVMYIILWVTPSKKERHIEICGLSFNDIEYCPICGIKKFKIKDD